MSIHLGGRQSSEYTSEQWTRALSQSGLHKWSSCFLHSKFISDRIDFSCIFYVTWRWALEDFIHESHEIANTWPNKPNFGEPPPHYHSNIFPCCLSFSVFITFIAKFPIRPLLYSNCEYIIESIVDSTDVLIQHTFVECCHFHGAVVTVLGFSACSHRFTPRPRLNSFLRMKEKSEVCLPSNRKQSWGPVWCLQCCLYHKEPFL